MLSLQALEVELFVRGVLIHNEEVVLQPCDNEAQIELANHLQLPKILFSEEQIENKKRKHIDALRKFLI